MSRLIKHEFRATARLILPFLAVSVFSALLFSFLDKSNNQALLVLTAVVCSVSLMALAIIGLIIIISRFYRNIMTDQGYLTMTLPLNSHEFIWAELIMCLCWFLIVAVVLFVTFIAVLGNLNMISVPESLGEIGKLFSAIRTACNEHGASILMVAVIILEGMIAVLLAFFGYCLRFYNAMALGQVFSKNRVLWSVLAYMLLGIVIGLVFAGLVYVFGNALSFNSFELGKAALALGLFDLILIIIDSLMYFPTSLLIGRKLNLP